MDTITQNRLQDLLLLALKGEGAEMGLIRSFSPDDEELVIISHHGLDHQFISQFHTVKPFDHSACGRAFGIGSAIIISDIEADLTFKKQIKFFESLNTKFRAIRAVPILTRKGRKVGTLSVFFREPKWDWHFRPIDKPLSDIADLLYELTKEEMSSK